MSCCPKSASHRTAGAVGRGTRPFPHVPRESCRDRPTGLMVLPYPELHQLPQPVSPCACSPQQWHPRCTNWTDLPFPPSTGGTGKLGMTLGRAEGMKQHLWDLDQGVSSARGDLHPLWLYTQIQQQVGCVLVPAVLPALPHGAGASSDSAGACRAATSRAGAGAGLWDAPSTPLHPERDAARKQQPKVLGCTEPCSSAGSSSAGSHIPPAPCRAGCRDLGI